MSCFVGSRSSGGISYTVPVSEAVSGESAILRGKNGVAGLYSGSDELRSCIEVFKRGKAQAGPDAPCLGGRETLPGGAGFGEYKWLTYGEVQTRAERLASGLAHLNLVPEISFQDESQQGGNFRFLCLYAKNRVEWNLLELAANLQQVTLIPMYDTLGEDGLKYIADHTKLQTIVVSAQTVKQVLAVKTQAAASASACSIGNVILLDAISDSDLAALRAAGVRVFTLAEVEEAGKQNPVSAKASEADAVCLLMFTSGTTGNPKGVMTTNRMICSMLPKLDTLHFPLTKDDCILSYLPSAHVFDRMTAFVLYFVGGRIGFSCGDITKILDDCHKLQPTVFPAVPRVLSRFHAKIWDGIRQKPGFLQSLVALALNTKLANLDNLATAAPGSGSGKSGTGAFSHWLWDALVFKKFRALLGGRVRLVICGAAPISPQVLREFRCFFSCPVMEVYGMTETTGGGCLAYDVDPTPEGGVGAPNTECEVKLVSVPEMNYHADGVKDTQHVRGEICFRGPCVTPGYFRAPELTKEAKDEQGWLHTGDVGELMQNGGIKVIDRKKNIFKLAQGEYICAEKIEQVYLRAPGVGQVFLHGDSTEVYPVAVVVVNEDWKKRHPDLTGDQLKKELKTQMDAVANEAKLLGFEKAKDIFVSPEAFSVENNLLTPTMKMKRHDAKLKFAPEIKNMYAAIKKAEKPANN